MSDRYYLNNMSNSVINLTLSTRRTIQPFTSLPLNTKDIVIFKAMKAARKGKSSMLDNVRLSKIRIEDDANYEVLTGKKKPEVIEEVKEDVKPAEDIQKDEQADKKEEKPEDKKEDKKDAKSEDKKEDKQEGKKATEEDLAKKALEQGLDAQFI